MKILKHRIFRITVSFILLACLAYIPLRIHAARAADRGIDEFFAAFRTGGWDRIANDLTFLSQQSRKDAEAIVLRQPEAMLNFPSAMHYPELNVMLNSTRVEVSWHLSIVFSKRGGRWVPTYFDEFVADPAGT